jgi:hypothetical protein
MVIGRGVHYHIYQTMEQQNTLVIVDPKYQRTLIYGIQCMTTGEMYVGSTCETLDERIAKHIRLCDCSAWQILERGNYKAYVIQRWPCNTKREVLTLEGGWQRAYKASFGDFLVNKKIEGSFYRENTEAKRAYNKEHYEEHKEERKVYDKKYHEEHKDERNAQNRKYHQEHKSERNARVKRPWTCQW